MDLVVVETWEMLNAVMIAAIWRNVVLVSGVVKNGVGGVVKEEIVGVGESGDIVIVVAVWVVAV